MTTPDHPKLVNKLIHCNIVNIYDCNMQMRFLAKKLQYANFFKVFKFKDFFKIKWKNRVVVGVVEGVQLALAIYSREYFGRRPIET